MVISVLQLLVGGVLLYLGAEWLVGGAAGLARAVGMRPLVVGLTVVAYGTSAPELTVGVAASADGLGGLVLGNAIGSNIANLGLILGLTALVSPPRTDGSLVRREVPVLILSTLAVPLLLRDGILSRLDGALLCAGAIAYSVWTIRGTKVAPETPAVIQDAAETAGGLEGRSRAHLAGRTMLGLALLVGGGKLFVDGAVSVAHALGMSERVVGLTVVAVGTSLPELATSLVAALRGHADIALGNVLGSNIFNLLLILGVSAIVRPVVSSPGALTFDLAVLGAGTLVTAVLLRSARTLSRIEGAALLAGYVGFVVALLRG